MPDISLCVNDNCPLRQDCLRFNADPDSLWQSYGDFEPDDEGNCDFYIKMPDLVWYKQDEE